MDDIAKASSCWGDDEFADATIIMGQRSWGVHRMIICNQSQYFKKALEGHFMVSAVDGMILLGDMLMD